MRKRIFMCIHGAGKKIAISWNRKRDQPCSFIWEDGNENAPSQGIFYCGVDFFFYLYFAKYKEKFNAYVTCGLINPISTNEFGYDKRTMNFKRRFQGFHGIVGVLCPFTHIHT